MQFKLQTQQVALTNMLYAIFAPYCGADKIAALALNNKAESPAYPVLVTCVHSTLRIDAPGKVVKLP